ncbi:hypothetical protein [Thermoactinomyces sp. DSM 45892]|uniref:phage scaffolding protein n=1 Tax=Thermoactinomyces sp. DSM 45892 TaxID=1882753 RepID=UPI0008965A35|nr:hypothetical protein [Thermoactinomyces sp. DSM 45892]SDZ05057.1 hypothetical protein SAMN05444416_11278 [Thermoactinomyces sp. DSM 45892]
MEPNEVQEIVDLQAEKKVKTLTEDEVNEIVRSRVNKVKEKYSDYNQLKSRLEKLMDERKQREESEMTELDRLKKSLGEKDETVGFLQKEIDLIREKAQQQKIQMIFQEKARSAGVEFVEDAYRLADLSSLQIVEGEEIRGIDEVVSKLVEERPFLLASKPKQKPIGGPSNHELDKYDKKTNEDLLKAAFEKARTSGRLEDRVAYATLKRELGK